MNKLFLLLSGGWIQGVCVAGYLCVSGSADSTPQGPLPDVNQCQWGMQCAGPCPPGTVQQFQKKPENKPNLFFGYTTWIFNICF